ncbi:hypothetical protein [Streptomyces sp. NPDC092295]|uniref:hypothetical protein n=1 Tax=Streptomyces sp. NPDC092295 TaxID=3366011 RepID=UPI003814B36C
MTQEALDPSIRQVSVGLLLRLAERTTNHSAAIVGVGLGALSGICKEAADPVGDGLVPFDLEGPAVFDTLLAAAAPELAGRVKAVACGTKLRWSTPKLTKAAAPPPAKPGRGALAVLLDCAPDQIGFCVKCREPTHRYGYGGNPLCRNCREQRKADRSA